MYSLGLIFRIMLRNSHISFLIRTHFIYLPTAIYWMIMAKIFNTILTSSMVRVGIFLILGEKLSISHYFVPVFHECLLTGWGNSSFPFLFFNHEKVVDLSNVFSYRLRKSSFCPFVISLIFISFHWFHLLLSTSNKS